METVSHHGRTTAYRHARPDAGGPTVLYVHGSGATHRVWARQYAPDGPAHPAVALDLSGHGESEDVDAEPGESALQAYVRDVRAVAEATGARVVVGNSLGGAVALEAVLDGLSASALVLAGTGAKLTVADHLRELLAADFPAAVDWLHGRDRLFHDADESAVSRSRDEMLGVGRDVTRRDFETCHRFDRRAAVGEVRTPALAVVGDHDALTPPSYHEFFAEELPDCDLATVPDAAHLAMVERPAAFNDRVAEFLADRT